MVRRVVLPKAQEWCFELEDFVRGLSGGFLFGIPLLYTMEAWWIGSFTEPQQMLVVIAVTYAIVFFLNRTDGFRQLRADSPKQAAMDSVEALAIAILCTVFLLMLLQEITPQTPLDEAVGKTVIEGMPFAVGVALARSILKEDDSDDEAAGGSHSTDASAAGQDPKGADSDQSTSSGRGGHDTLRDIGATLVGAIIIASNIAPTDEVAMLEAALSPPWMLALLTVSLVLSYCIVFVAGFASQKKRRQQKGLFQSPLTETVMTYLVSLLAAALMLWFFHRLSLDDPWTLWFKEALILGLPATIGGAAGRLAI